MGVNLIYKFFKLFSTLNEHQLEAFTVEMYNRGQYSPVYGSGISTMPGIEVIPEDEDALRLEKQRFANKKGNIKPRNVSLLVGIV